ncbi:MAG: DUF523 domain-containing protein [Candidatus Eisenbacteria sp.]|nr:DUF523 domain-containing protein [Candidatus Eisenbacteria bacterium]
MKAISACLLGLACRYDGTPLPAEKLLSPAAGDCWVPVCPEQLGGLPTPRTPAEIEAGTGEDVLAGRARVVSLEGGDVTAAFLRGAHQTLALCRCLGIREVVLKSRSPSCGVGRIYRAGALVAGNGVTTALLQREGIDVRVYPD